MTNEPPPNEEPREPEATPSEAPAVPPEVAAAGAAAETPAPGMPSGPRRLYRSRTDEWFGGVAGGLADYFNADPTLIRVAFVAAALLSSGFGVLAYIVAWIVIPEEPNEAADSATGATRQPRARRDQGNTSAIVWGGILIIAGSLFLLAQLDLDIDFPSWEVGLSLALIFVGLLMLFEARNGFHGGLMTLAVILTVLLGVSAASSFNLDVDGAFGDQQHTIRQAEELEDSYSHVFGSLGIDLRELELPEGETDVEVSIVFGDVDVRLPEGVAYRLELNSVFGGIDAPDASTEGIASSRTYTSPGYDEADRRLDIQMSTVFGSGSIR